MKEFLKYVLKLFLFWIILFIVQRMVFLFYNHSELSGVPWKSVLLSYWYGLGLDISTTAFVMTFPVVFGIVNLFARKRIWVRLSNILTLLFVVISLVIGILDTGLYSNWGSKLNAKAFSYVFFPGETFGAMNAVPVWLFFIIFIIETALAFFIYLKWIRAKVPEKTNIFLSALIGVLILSVLPVAYRGGLQKYPIGRSHVYFSRYMVLNYAALNGPWNTIDVLVKAKKTENPYRYFDDKKALSIFKETNISGCDSTVSILKNKRPNIVLILIESGTAENMMTLGGKERNMPGMDSLTHEGLLFTRFYSTGFRTEQGMISFLSGFPAQPTVTIMREFGKFEKLPNLGRIMADHGYNCNYYYSGDLDFANTRPYLNSSSFSKLLDKENRTWNRTTTFGALDEELFQCHLKEAGNDKQPFFSIIMTSTSHEPFDAPVTKTFAGNDERTDYRNTIHYTDSCIFSYIQQAKKTSWFANTLFIITSDHAHFYPLNRNKYDAERHHIPFLILGGALDPEWRGKTIDRVSSQTDFAATILKQLDLESSQFIYSKDLFDPCEPQLAFYTFDNGFGFITPEQTIIFDHDLRQVLYKEKNLPAAQDSAILAKGKAYLQVMYEEYLKLNR
jgi:phosphoglycerol transferase MdoB-like AlkP superfamily enzyme